MEDNQKLGVGIGLLVGFLATIYILGHKNTPPEMSTKQLEKLRDRYVAKENYEKAAEIRDLIKLKTV